MTTYEDPLIDWNRLMAYQRELAHAEDAYFKLGTSENAKRFRQALYDYQWAHTQWKCSTECEGT